MPDPSGDLAGSARVVPTACPTPGDPFVGRIDQEKNAQKEMEKTLSTMRQSGSSGAPTSLQRHPLQIQRKGNMIFFLCDPNLCIGRGYRVHEKHKISPGVSSTSTRFSSKEWLTRRIQYITHTCPLSRSTETQKRRLVGYVVLAVSSHRNLQTLRRQYVLQIRNSNMRAPSQPRPCAQRPRQRSFPWRPSSSGSRQARCTSRLPASRSGQHPSSPDASPTPCHVGQKHKRL